MKRKKKGKSYHVPYICIGKYLTNLMAIFYTLVNIIYEHITTINYDEICTNVGITHRERDVEDEDYDQMVISNVFLIFCFVFLFRFSFIF